MAYVLDGCPVTLCHEADVHRLITQALRSRERPPLAVASLNLDHLHHFGTTGAGRSVLPLDDPSLSWMMLLDGAPLVMKARRDTGVAWPRLAGSDLLPGLLALAVAEGASVGFLGGRPEMHLSLAGVLAEDYAGLQVSGYWAPGREELTDETAMSALADEVAAAGTDVLVVGLGKPRQEEWISRSGVRSRARVLLAFGASADFMAGWAERAPDWSRRYAMEWAWRLSQEPRRLARRYLMQAPPALARMLAGPSAGPDTARPPVLPEPVRGVDVVIVAYNSEREIGRLLASIPDASEGLDVRVLVVDNGSTDDSVAVVRQVPDVQVVATGLNLGYAGGINAATPHLRPDADAVALLNPDLKLEPGFLTALAAGLGQPGVGMVAPRLVDATGHPFPSLRREPRVTGAVGEALFGDRLGSRPALLTDTLRGEHNYRHARPVEWTSGAAVMIRRDCLDAVGPWEERYFLYSEEVDYARRVREAGFRIDYIPEAVASHVGGASGGPSQLRALEAVNRVRDFEATHALIPSLAFRAAVLLRHALRSLRAADRDVLASVARRATWPSLPKGASSMQLEPPPAPRDASPPSTIGPRGSMIIPAHDEGTTIRRGLRALAEGLGDAEVEVIVVPNGCGDDTAEQARTSGAPFPVRVLEIDRASKQAALRAGDAATDTFPRIYLDADVVLSGRSVVAVLDALAGGALAARPPFRYDTWGASPLVQAFYRARTRMPQVTGALWGAGVYGVSRVGRARWGEFPDDVPDDLFVDHHFRADEITVVDTDPVVVFPPRDTASLLRTLKRVYRRDPVAAAVPGSEPSHGGTAGTVAGLARSAVTSPDALVDAGVYAALVVLARLRRGKQTAWERDTSSR